MARSGRKPARWRRKKKPQTPGQRVFTLFLAGLALAIITAAERDLLHRPPDEIRGNKRLWQVVSLNALGALAYFRWGRLPAQAA